MSGFITTTEQLLELDENFRQVLATGAHSQLVAMTLARARRSAPRSTTTATRSS